MMYNNINVETRGPCPAASCQNAWSDQRALLKRRYLHKRALSKRRYYAKETYNFKEPSNRRHPIERYDLSEYKYAYCTKGRDSVIGWWIPVGCLISTDHFQQQSPLIGGSFAEKAPRDEEKYCVAETCRMLYLCRSFSAKKSYD